MTTIVHLITAAALAASPVVAAAQAPAEEAAPTITLGIDAGTVRVSTGGEFVQASPGQILAPGHRVMVGEDGAATLTYANGCQKQLVHTGVYLVDGLCDAEARQSGGSNTGLIVGGVAGAAALAAMAGGGGGGGGGGDVAPPPPPPPISP